MLKAGAQIGSYRVVREIGHGAMGIVYEGVHQDIERRAAIKVLQPDLSRDPQFLARLRNEARATNRVRHPGLVEIFEFGALPEGPAYIIMEYLEGESLRERLLRAGGALPDARALDIARQVATALASAH